MSEFKPPELTFEEVIALGLAAQIAICQITGVEFETEESIAVFRKNHMDLLVSLTAARQKLAQATNISSDTGVQMRYDGSGDIQTALTRLDARPERNQEASDEDEGNGDRRW